MSGRLNGQILYLGHMEEGEEAKVRIQLEEGTQKTDYDQYGYKIPLENNGTAFETLYLPEPLPQGAYAEYGTQRIRRADGEFIPAALPQLTAHAGANSITAGTTVPPTTISVKYK